MISFCPFTGVPDGFEMVVAAAACAVISYTSSVSAFGLHVALELMVVTRGVIALLVSVLVLEMVGTATPSTVIAPAPERAIVVSEAAPSSIDPTPRAVLVEAVSPAIGRPVALVNVPLDGVPRAPPLSNTAVPSTVIAPAPERAIVVSLAAPSSIEPTPRAVEVEAVMPATGNPVALVRVPEDGVPNAPPLSRTFVPSTASTPELARLKVVSVACPSSIEPTPKAVEVEAVIPLTGKPVALVRVKAVGVPRSGVTRAGDVPKTNAPLPVSFVMAEAKLALVGVPRKVATPVPNPVMPVDRGRPVADVSTAADGVPSAGVVKTGLVAVRTPAVVILTGLLVPIYRLSPPIAHLLVRVTFVPATGSEA